jgi:HlyD family secretion protein
MQAPTLFVIAADLTKMQVNANIDEADVGRIRPGQHVTFRVDAYASETFEGTVSQIRLQPVVVQNVTTYGTVIDVPNAQLKLKPGMTANVKVEIAKRTDVLRVPNAALRFRPTADVFAALNQAVPPEVQFAGGGRSNRRGTGASTQSSGASPQSAGASAQNSGASTQSAGASGQGAGASAQGAGASAQGAGASAQGAGTTGQSADSNGGDRRGGRGFDPARMMERFKGMSSEEQKQFIARMKDRGQDTSAFEKEMSVAGQQKTDSTSTLRPKYGSAAPPQTIDALFAPLPVVETRGRAWLFMNHELKPVNLRLGVSDGTYTELVSGELQPNMEVVTGVTGLGTTRAQPGQGGSGNPLMPGGRGPGGFGGAGGRGR